MLLIISLLCGAKFLHFFTNNIIDRRIENYNSWDN
jgi:hypothetical protein